MFCILLCFYLWIYGPLNKISYHINASKREAVDPSLRPRGHWNRNVTSHCTTQSKLINIGLYGYLAVLCTSCLDEHIFV